MKEYFEFEIEENTFLDDDKDDKLIYQLFLKKNNKYVEITDTVNYESCKIKFIE